MAAMTEQEARVAVQGIRRLLHLYPEHDMCDRLNEAADILKEAAKAFEKLQKKHKKDYHERRNKLRREKEEAKAVRMRELDMEKERLEGGPQAAESESPSAPPPAAEPPKEGRGGMTSEGTLG